MHQKRIHPIVFDQQIGYVACRKIQVDDIYFVQAIFKDFIISKTPGKFGDKILTAQGTV